MDYAPARDRSGVVGKSVMVAPDRPLREPAVSPGTPDLASLAARASTITERLQDAYVPIGASDDPVIDRRLQAWCQAVAKGDWAQFRHRLRWEGLDEATVRPVLGRVELRDGVPLPEWTEVIAAVAGRERAPAAMADLLQPDHPIPFEDILAPFVRLGEEMLRERAGETYSVFSDRARIDLARQLLSRLSTIAARILFFEFSLVRSRELSSFALLLTPEGERTMYDDFVESLRGSGLIAFFHRYPVLARLLGNVVLLWVEANAEMLQRLVCDAPELERLFGTGCRLGMVQTLQSGLSDPHNRGRTVAAMTFTGGQCLVYKPKRLGTEVAFNDLLTWVNRSVERSSDAVPLLPFRVLKVLDRGTHGWVEHVENEPCTDTEAAGRYYVRAGMLLALLYALGGNDCHMENLIACGDSPILIDLETLMHHRGVLEDIPDQAGASTLAHEVFESSVLRVGLLPTWQLESENRVAYDVSGLGSLSTPSVSVPRQRWREMNTDRMSLATVEIPIPAHGNIPILDGEPLQLDAYAVELQTGFESMYRFLVEQRGALLAASGPLAALTEERVRFVYRSTRIYAVLQHQLLDAAHLGDGADWSIGLEVLARAVMPQSQRGREAGDRSVFWPVVVAEREALERGDIPYFVAPAGSTHLPLRSGPVECFESSCMEWALQRLRTMDEADLQRQVAMIQGTIYSYLARDSEPVSASENAGASEPESETGSPDDLIAAALEIAAEIRERAVIDPDGSLAWIVPHYLIQAERYQLQPSGPDLYDGGGGIALFFAALERVTGGGFRDLALGALQPLRRELQQYGDRAARHNSIGGATGFGSMVYALVGADRFLDDPELLADARAVARLITNERITDDRALDVIQGSAGAILGLLSLYEVDSDRNLLEQALRAGEHLLQNRQESSAGPRAWPTVGRRLMTGFSHGAAGISYALVRLYRATGESAFLEAATEGIAYEDAVFDQDQANWPDLRYDPPGFMSAWCHGAAGIGLARLGGLDVLDSDQIRRDLELALAATERQRLDRHIVCCGGMGRAELLLSAGLELQRPRLVESAHGLANRILRHRRQQGTFHVHPNLPASVYNPSLFQGTAGIGYQLLRLAEPTLIPAFLQWR